jgi:hypothetical protein
MLQHCYRPTPLGVRPFILKHIIQWLSNRNIFIPENLKISFAGNNFLQDNDLEFTVEFAKWETPPRSENKIKQFNRKVEQFERISGYDDLVDMGIFGAGWVGGRICISQAGGVA